MNKKTLPQNGAFTLIELLVVMGIIVLMGTLIVPAVGGALKGNALTQSSQNLVAQFNNAQQLALAKGQTIEMRLFMCGDPDSPTADKEDSSTWKLRGVQLYTVQPNQDVTTVATIKQKYAPITKLEFMPNSILMDAGSAAGGSTLTTLCDPSLLRDHTDTEDYQHPKLPRIGLGYKYYHFLFHSDGSTDLQGNKSWYVTLRNLVNDDKANNGDKLQKVPNNFFTVLIDATQGTTRTFRPM